MKVTVNEESKEQVFPKLMISSSGGEVVLMQGHGKGTLLNDASPSIALGEWSDGWNTHVFKDLIETAKPLL